jgi:DNA-binding transcriptional MerR regulator
MGINEVAERLGQKPQTIRAYVRQGLLPKRQLVPGGRLKFTERDIERLVEGRPS